jgi:hypothetical protein
MGVPRASHLFFLHNVVHVPTGDALAHPPPDGGTIGPGDGLLFLRRHDEQTIGTERSATKSTGMSILRNRGRPAPISWHEPSG